MNTPILLVAFNRVDTTKQVLSVIRQAKPKQLFFAVDAPRNKEEAVQCSEVKALIKTVDWPCQVKVLFPKENLGCRLGVTQAITWFFEHVEQGIILEDDCVPDLSFFKFCEELLDKYKDNNQIMHISGSNFQDKKQGDASYYFSNIPKIWGWATWRRAWKLYDIKMKTFPSFVEAERIKEIFTKPIVQKFWLEVLNKYYLGKNDTWDFQWSYVLFSNNGLAIEPQVNLVSNIGCGADAVHVASANHKLANNPTQVMQFPLKHPGQVVASKQANNRDNKYIYGATYWNYGVKKILKRLGLFDVVKLLYLKIKK